MTAYFTRTIRCPSDYEAFADEYEAYMDALQEANEASAELADFPSDEEMEAMYQWAVAEGLTT